MVHSIELVFDRDTEAAVRQLWAELAAAGIPGQTPAGRPHVTLTVAGRIAPEVDGLLAPLGERMPLRCVVGAPVLLGRDASVLARLVVPTTALLELQAEVHRCCLPHLVPGPLPHTAPGRWTAHVTVARRVRSEQLGWALQIAGRPAELEGHFAGLRRWDGDERIEHPLS